MQNENETNGLKVTVLHNGPLMLEDNCLIEKQTGELIKEGEKLFLCRCGESSNKPFCDGSHKKANFEAE